MRTERSKNNAFKVLIKALESLDGVTGKVGWFPGLAYESGIPVAQVMALNEFGHGPTPARPTGRITIAENKSAWRDLALSASRQTVQGKISAYQAVSKLTEKAEGDWKRSIENLYSPALSPVTIELRAMKKRDPNLKITGATVGIAARRVRQPGYQTPAVNTKPLIDTDFAHSTLTHRVDVTA